MKEEGSNCAVDNAVVSAEADAHALADDDVVIFVDDGLFEGAADGEDAGIGVVDDAVKAVDSVHAEVGDGEGGAAHFSRCELFGASFVNEFAGFTADGDEVFFLGIPDDGCDEAILKGYAKGEVDCAVLVNVGSFPGGVHGRSGAKGFGSGFENVVVDGELDGLAVFLEFLVDGGPNLQEGSGINFFFQIKVGNGGFGFE